MIDYASLSPYISTTEDAVLPSQGIIALGEATHRNKEFTLLKLQLFQQIVEQSDIRAFVLEGDFGGCQKMNQYIQTGEGTAADATSSIGFEIYKTEEMVQMIDWMRDFNVGKETSEQVRFYGYDMQRYDTNKEGLFAILGKAAPSLKEEYSLILDGFTDESMFDLDATTVEPAIANLEALNAQLETQKDNIIAISGAENYALAYEYATSILENTKLRISDNYGVLRDQYMAEHVSWVENFEETYYGKTGIFITGHNGHIGKTNATVGTEKSMGEILSEEYGTDYYSIGTEFGSTHFLAQDDTRERKEFTVENQGDTRLAVILSSADIDPLFPNVDEAAKNSTLADYLSVTQPMGSIGDYFLTSYEQSEVSYTQKLSPSQTYDALIYVKDATPSTMLQES